MTRRLTDIGSKVIMVPMPTSRIVASASLLAIGLSGCGSGTAPAAGGGGGGGGKLPVVASFYPLQYIAERIGGDRVNVTSLTKPGAEPHDLELTPQDVAGLADTGLVVYLKGFQPAVDTAVSSQAADKAFDASTSANLDLTYTPIEAGKQVDAEAGSTDPHFWLDPVRLQAVATALAARMTQAQPAAKDVFATNLAALSSDLRALDGEFSTGLANCANKDLVTSHNAFGYLSERYGMTQVGITGLTPDGEPDTGQLAKVTDFVRANKVHTIYYETLISPAIAKTVASETGAATEVLDPIEGLNDRSQGRDYLAVMRANLANLERGQPCR